MTTNEKVGLRWQEDVEFQHLSGNKSHNTAEPRQETAFSLERAEEAIMGPLGPGATET